MYQTFMVAHGCKTAKSFLLRCTTNCKIILFCVDFDSTYNTCDISWDSSGIFSPLNVCFFELGCQKEKIDTGREGAQGTAQGVPT